MQLPFHESDAARPPEASAPATSEPALGERPAGSAATVDGGRSWLIAALAMVASFAALFLVLSLRTGHHPVRDVTPPAPPAIGGEALRQVVRGAPALVVARPTMAPERFVGQSATDSLVSAGFVVDQVLSGSKIRTGTGIEVVRLVPDRSPGTPTSLDPAALHPFAAGVYVLALEPTKGGRWSVYGGTNGVLRFFAKPDRSGLLLPDDPPTPLQEALDGTRHRDVVRRIRVLLGKSPD